MGFTEALTLVFIVLKLIGVISWGWFYVLLPEIIACGIYLIIALLPAFIWLVLYIRDKISSLNRKE